MNNQKLTFKTIATIIKAAPITTSRIAKSDPTFPEIETIGGSKFIDSEPFYKWLSKQARHEVKEGDYALTDKDLQNIFDKSHTWIWQRDKAGELPKPFYIGRKKLRMNSQIEALLNHEEAA